MPVAPALANALVQWLDLLTWTSRAALVGVEVAFEAGLHERWDDLRWDADHDRKMLRGQMEDWQVDERQLSTSRAELAAEWQRFGASLDIEAVPSPDAQRHVDVALQWLMEQRARFTNLAVEAVHSESASVQADFANMLDEMCLVE